MIEKFKTIADFILEGLNYKPEVGIVLGSGLGGLGDKIEADKIIPYENIPDFPVSTVEGHKGRLIIGTLGCKKIVAMQGRFHYYEGYTMDQITLPIRVMKYLGIKFMFVSNAAGGMNPEFNIGDIMLIRDHINYFPVNPLVGPNNADLGPRFPDMSKCYSRELIGKTKEIAKEHNIPLQEGVYIGSSGPTLETPAEYKMFRIWGADATGMSTVPEVIVANHMGIQCFGLSVITNTDQPTDDIKGTTHEDVQNVAQTVEPNMTLLIKELMMLI
ncbi:MAG: purine-nucleoside phosphorylase [Salinivirgaceae bacterium]|jgi:purine-nucleoside phosphorylase|nr:purine-nucleoside phosphorylase [Salinivirgaceae bacterium]